LSRQVSANHNALIIIGIALAVGAALWVVGPLVGHPKEDWPKEPLPSRAAIWLALDAGAKKIDSLPTATTCAELLRIPRPADLADDISTARYQEIRIPPLETKIWRVEATITQVVVRDDNDFYLILDDGAGMVVAELPPPEMVAGSVFGKKMRGAREAIEAKLHPTKAPRNPRQKVVVTALGFFGKAKPGANGARLQPIISVDWK
jgi:hypothetical protein